MAQPPSNQKAYLRTEKGQTIPCLFNPKELQIKLTAKWDGSAQPGIRAPQVVYQGGESGELSLTLELDTTSDGKPVTNHTDKLVKLIYPDAKDEKKKERNARPQWVTFHWGKFHSFKSVLTSLDLKYTHFSSKGEPLRATAAVTLKQFEPEAAWPRQNPTSGTPRPARSHQVQPGETLDRIAAKYYGDATKWRGLAEVNKVRDPFALTPGSLLDVPIDGV